ncbi:hypothetical protein MASR2M78_17910 [Treponema sp.]
MNLILRNRELDSPELGMTDQLSRLQHELGRFFDLGFDNAGLLDRSIAPAADLLETRDEYVLYVDLPGIEKKNLELTAENHALTLKGEKKEPKKDIRFFRQETWSGSFQRTISLPSAADPENIRAEFVNGVLSVRIGKRKELMPRQISVAVN